MILFCFINWVSTSGFQGDPFVLQKYIFIHISPFKTILLPVSWKYPCHKGIHCLTVLILCYPSLGRNRKLQNSTLIRPYFEIRCLDDCTQNRYSDFFSILMDLCILVKSSCSLWSKTTGLRSRCSTLEYHWIYQCPDKFQDIPKSLDTWKQTALIFLMNRTYAFTCKTSVWSLFTGPSGTNW